mmetsp:Transcript_165720/g.532087  ORF Transcript_165720/g.532087 Transcript_165720/m.532087 type:complete len:723 (+) Transcript_165720:557-2725(+)
MYFRCKQLCWLVHDPARHPDWFKLEGAVMTISPFDGPEFSVPLSNVTRLKSACRKYTDTRGAADAAIWGRRGDFLAQLPHTGPLPQLARIAAWAQGGGRGAAGADSVSRALFGSSPEVQRFSGQCSNVMSEQAIGLVSVLLHQKRYALAFKFALQRFADVTAHEETQSLESSAFLLAWLAVIMIVSWKRKQITRSRVHFICDLPAVSGLPLQQFKEYQEDLHCVAWDMSKDRLRHKFGDLNHKYVRSRSSFTLELLYLLTEATPTQPPAALVDAEPAPSEGTSSFWRCYSCSPKAPLQPLSLFEGLERLQPGGRCRGGAAELVCQAIEDFHGLPGQLREMMKGWERRRNRIAENFGGRRADDFAHLKYFSEPSPRRTAIGCIGFLLNDCMGMLHRHYVGKAPVLMNGFSITSFVIGFAFDFCVRCAIWAALQRRLYRLRQSEQRSLAFDALFRFPRDDPLLRMRRSQAYGSLSRSIRGDFKRLSCCAEIADDDPGCHWEDLSIFDFETELWTDSGGAGNSPNADAGTGGSRSNEKRRIWYSRLHDWFTLRVYAQLDSAADQIDMELHLLLVFLIILTDIGQVMANYLTGADSAYGHLDAANLYCLVDVFIFSIIFFECLGLCVAMNKAMGHHGHQLRCLKRNIELVVKKGRGAGRLDEDTVASFSEAVEYIDSLSDNLQHADRPARLMGIVIDARLIGSFLTVVASSSLPALFPFVTMFSSS